jgi:hypothetical protein
MGGVSKDYITYYPGFGFDLLFKVTEVKVKKLTKLRVLLRFDLECSNLV